MSKGSILINLFSANIFDKLSQCDMDALNTITVVSSY